MDDVADEFHQESHNPITDHVGADTEGFSGRPQDTSVLTNYAYRVATRVSAGEVVICLIISYLNNHLSF